MDAETKKTLMKIVFDFNCLLIVGLPILAFYLAGVPYQRGFFCDDESIMYPFRDSTVSNTMLYICGMAVPAVIMLIVEIVTASRGPETGSQFKIFGREIPLWLSNSYKVIGIFGFGAGCSQLLTDIGKYSIGRLRPHFFEVCQPDINCSLAENQHKYIESFRCLGTDNHLLKDARLSFPSGHSSFSAYTMLYLAIYLQCRLSWRGSKLWKHVLQFICIGLMWFTALSRVSNNKHHWSDVTVGLIIGTIVALVNAFCVSDLFRKRQHRLFLADGTDMGNSSVPLTSKNNATVNV